MKIGNKRFIEIGFKYTGGSDTIIKGYYFKEFYLYMCSKFFTLGKIKINV